MYVSNSPTHTYIYTCIRIYIRIYVYMYVSNSPTHTIYYVLTLEKTSYSVGLF
jgi:hypothetical protein